MWNRKELKAKGKAAYKANRFVCIIAALLLTFAAGAGSVASGAGSSATNNNNNNNNINNSNNSGYEQELENELKNLEDSFDADNSGSGSTSSDDSYGYKNDGSSESSGGSGDAAVFGVIGILVLLLILIICFLAAAASIFVFNPFRVGLRKFFIENSDDPETGLTKTNMGLAFGNNYMDVVGAMFTTRLFIGLWTILFIIPGVYKSYCWRMVPYIISENPGISGKEARGMSAAMMKGSKWASFVLDLSFLGWSILGAFTLGILNIVFTNPYKAATDAELYLTLEGMGGAAAAAPADIPEMTAAPFTGNSAEAAVPAEAPASDIVIDTVNEPDDREIVSFD